MFSSNRRVMTIVCGVTMLALLISGTALAQDRIARANSAVGQKAVFKVVGNQLPVCLGVYTVDNLGNLLTFTSVYVGALQTKQVVPQVTPSFPTTTMFAIYETAGGGPGQACASAPSLGSFLNDPTREPEIYETLAGGSDNPVVSVKQFAAIANIGVSICGNLNTPVQTVLPGANIESGAGNQNISPLFSVDCSTFRSINAIAQIANTSAVVTYGFEDIEFQPSAGNALASLISNCQSPVFSSNQGFTITCSLPVGGGAFSNQSY